MIEIIAQNKAKNINATTSKKVLPQTIGELHDFKTSKDLGISYFENLAKTKGIDFANFQITYKIKSISDILGQIVLDVDVRRGGTKQMVELTVTGYKTLEKKLQEDLELIKTNFDVDQFTKQINKIPDWEVETTETAENLGIIVPDLDGATAQFTIKSSNPNTGEVKISCVLTKTQQNITKTLTIPEILIKNFKNVTEKTKEDFEKIKKLLIDTTTTEKEKMPSEVQITTTDITNLKITPLTTAQLDGATVEYQIKVSNDVEGKIALLIKLTKNDKNDERTIIISGFQTKEQRETKELDDFIGAASEEESTRFSHKIPSQI